VASLLHDSVVIAHYALVQLLGCHDARENEMYAVSLDAQRKIVDITEFTRPDERAANQVEGVDESSAHRP
jgi:hypothetical protein